MDKKMKNENEIPKKAELYQLFELKGYSLNREDKLSVLDQDTFEDLCILYFKSHLPEYEVTCIDDIDRHKTSKEIRKFKFNKEKKFVLLPSKYEVINDMSCFNRLDVASLETILNDMLILVETEMEQVSVSEVKDRHPSLFGREPLKHSRDISNDEFQNMFTDFRRLQEGESASDNKFKILLENRKKEQKINKDLTGSVSKKMKFQFELNRAVFQSNPSVLKKSFESYIANDYTTRSLLDSFLKVTATNHNVNTVESLIPVAESFVLVLESRNEVMDNILKHVDIGIDIGTKFRHLSNQHLSDYIDLARPLLKDAILRYAIIFYGNH